MKTQVNTKEFKDTLKILNRTADKFTDMSINIDKSCMNLGTHDIHAKLSVISDMEDINFFIRIKEFKKIMDGVKSENTLLQIVKNTLLINGIYKIPIGTEEFLKVDFFENEEGTGVTLPLESFIKALNKSVFYSKKPFKPALGGINFNFLRDTLAVSSTDGRCLNKEVIGLTGSNLELSITLKADNVPNFLSITKKEKDTNANIDIKIVYKSVTEDAFIFSYKNFTFKFFTIDDRFPDIERIIPNKNEALKNNYKTFNFDKLEAIEAMKIIATVANKDEREKRTYLRIEKKGISFIYLGNIYLDEKTAGVYIEASHNDSEGMIYAFNCEYLQQMFKCLDNESVELNINAGSIPAYIFENQSTYLLSSIREHDDAGEPIDFEGRLTILEYNVNIGNLTTETEGVKK